MASKIVKYKRSYQMLWVRFVCGIRTKSIDGKDK